MLITFGFRDISLLGTWDMRGSKFLNGIKINVWALVVLVDDRQYPDQTIYDFSNALTKMATQMGMPMNPNPCYFQRTQRNESPEQKLRDIKANIKDIQLVLVILPGRTSVYGEFR